MIQVIRTTETWLFELGYKKAVIESRDVAVEFYKKLEYVITDSKIIHGDRFDCVRMEKSL